MITTQTTVPIISATFTKQVIRSRNSVAIWVPRDVVKLLQLNPQSILEVKITKIGD
jgi:antitoxin component of MazEF toxin-antitoxin module